MGQRFVPTAPDTLQSRRESDSAAGRQASRGVFVGELTKGELHGKVDRSVSVSVSGRGRDAFVPSEVNTEGTLPESGG